MAFLKEQAFEYLTRARRVNRLAHAYLIHGARGSGKLELAEAICDLVSGTSLVQGLKRQDISTVEPESKSRRISVEQMRQLEGQLQMRAAEAGMKVGVIVDADRMLPAAANAFLKTLEEPPANSLLLLLTTQPESLLDTIISRCIEIPLKESVRPKLSEREVAMCELLKQFFNQGQQSSGAILGLAADILEVLAEVKDSIAAEAEEERKSEENQYAKTTDSTKWLKDRETYFKAITEASYIRERGRLLNIISLWWADALRHRQGGRLDLSEWADATAQLSDRASEKTIISALAALGDLARSLERNVAETLAIEAGLLRAFGNRPANP